MLITSALDIGPINGGIAILLLLGGAGVVLWSLRRLHHGEPVPLIPLALALAAPLALVLWAVTIQFPPAMAATDTIDDYWMRMTFKAGVLMRGVLTQWSGGIASAVLSLGMLGGAVALTVKGERPRWLVAGSGALLGLGAIAIALATLGAIPALLSAVRLLLYALTLSLCVAALLNTHRRGPGTQLCAIAALTTPIAVAGIDLIVLAEVTNAHMVVLAKAPYETKQALIEVYFAALDAFVLSASLSFGLALGIALLSPAILWSRDRARSAVLLVVVAIVAIGGSAAWTFSTSMTEDLRGAVFEVPKR